MHELEERGQICRESEMGEPSDQAGAAEFVRLAWTYVSSSGGREGKGRGVQSGHVTQF